jgi:uncharacterized protein (DUF433 family)
MNSNLERITIDEAICNGKPVIRGFRITVKTVLEYLAAGEQVENILAAYPFLVEADIKACIEFAAKTVDGEHFSLTAA